MGEVDTAPEVAAKVIEDLTALEVDPDKCERLYKAAQVQSNSGVTYRMLAKMLTTGKVDLTVVTWMRMANRRRSGRSGASLSRLPNGLTKSLKPSRRV
jgi:hypothetical protein